MRLFFALWPDSKTRNELKSVAETLRLADTGRPMRAANYHMTLAFLGEVSDSSLSQLLKIGGSQRTHGCSILLDAIEFWAKPQIVVAAAQRIPAELSGLWERLHKDLALQDFDAARAAVEQSLRAHVTLARKVAQAPVPQAMSSIKWSMNSLSLVRSDTSGTHSAYTVVDTWPLLYER